MISAPRRRCAESPRGRGRYRIRDRTTLRLDADTDSDPDAKGVAANTGWPRNEPSNPARTRTQPEGRYSYSNQHAPNRIQFHPMIPSARVRVRVPHSETHGEGTRISSHPLPNAEGVAADSPGSAEERGPPGVRFPNDPRTPKAVSGSLSESGSNIAAARCRCRHRLRRHGTRASRRADQFQSLTRPFRAPSRIGSVSPGRCPGYLHTPRLVLSPLRAGPVRRTRIDPVHPAFRPLDPWSWSATRAKPQSQLPF